MPRSVRPWEYQSYQERKSRELQEFDALASASLTDVVDPDPMRLEATKQAAKARVTRDEAQDRETQQRLDVGSTVREQVNPATSARERARGMLPGSAPATGSPRDRARAMLQQEPQDEGGGWWSKVGDVLAELDKPLLERAGVRLPSLPGPIDEAGNFVLEEASRPTTLAIAAGGSGLAARAGTAAAQLGAKAATQTGGMAAATRAASLGLKGTRAVTAPVVEGGLRRRLAAETTMGVGARLAGEQAAGLVPEDAPGVVKGGAAIVGGLAGGVAGARVAGGVLRGSGIDAAVPGRSLRGDAPEAVAPVADNKLGELFGLREVSPELTDRDHFANLMKETLTGGVPADPRVTPFMREYSRLMNSGGVLDSYASSVAEPLHVSALSAFDFDGVAIPSLRGVDPDLGGAAPTLADVAAKLPLYAERLSPQQVQVLRDIDDELRPLFEALTEQGIEIHRRGDIMEGGFYIPRGRVDVPGEEHIFAGSGGRRVGSRMSAEKSATFESQAAGIEAGYEYASPGEALKDYVRVASQRALDEHLKNYLKALDEAWTPGDDPALQAWRAQMTALRAKLATRTSTLRNQVNRLTQQQREAGRAGRTARDVARRAERTAEHQERGVAAARGAADAAGQALARESLAMSDEAGRFGRLALSAETRALMGKANIEEFEVWLPEIVRDQLPDAATLQQRATALREALEYTPKGELSRSNANMARARQLGEVEALKEIRLAADAGDDYAEFLRIIDHLGEDAARYTTMHYTATDRGAHLRSRMRRRGASAEEPPISGPWESIKVYDDIISRVASGDDVIAVSRNVAPEQVIKVAEAEMRRYQRLQARFERLSQQSMARGARAEARVGRKADEAARQRDISQRISEQGVTRAGREADAASGRATETAERVSATTREIESLRAELDQLIPQYQHIQRLAQQPPRGMARVQISGLEQSHAFPDRIAAAVNTVLEKQKPLQGRGAGPIRAVNAVNRLMRMLNATLDASFLGIQGLLGSVTDPEAYLEAMRVTYSAMRDPQALGSYLRTKDPAMLRQMVRDGVRIGGSNMEFTSTGISGQRGLGALATFLEDADWTGATLKAGSKSVDVPPALRGLNPVRGANRMFSTFGDVLRIELYEALSDVARASGLDTGDAAVRAAIANSANLMTGTGSRAFINDEIGGLAVFAPRYFQAQLDLIGKALTDGTIEGALARRTFTRLIGAAVGLTVAANALLGEETDLDPESSNFLRIRVAGTDVSVLGAWDSMLRAGMKAADGDLSYIARSKAAPVVRTAWDLLSGEDFVGEDTRNLGYAVTAFAPFSMQNTIKDGISPSSALDLAGVKASPMSPTDRLDAVARMEYGARFYDLEPQYQQAIREDHPDLWQAAIERRRGPGQRSAEVKLNLRAEQQADDELLLSGQLTREEWRDERRRRLMEHRIVLRELYGEERPSDEDAREDPSARYAQAIYDATDQTTGRVDWDAVEEMRAGFTREENRYIDDNTGVWNSPLSRAYREVTQEYFALPAWRGYSAEEGRAINAAYTRITNRAREMGAPYGREPDRALRGMAFQELKDELGLSDSELEGVRRRIMGLLKEDVARAQFRQERPEVVAFLGQGPLTATEQRILARYAQGSAPAAAPSARDRARAMLAGAR